MNRIVNSEHTRPEKKKCILWTLLGCGILNYDIILWGIKMLIGVGTNIIFIHGVDTGTSAICGPA